MDGSTTLRERYPSWEPLALGVGAVVVVAVSVTVGWSLPVGDRSGVLLPMIALAGLGLAVLAFVRFELFVMLVIAMRASLDVAKLSTSRVDATGALSIL